MNRLKLKRMLADLTQLELAKRVDLSEQQITKIETDRVSPPPKIRQRLADVLDASEEELFGEDETAPANISRKGDVREQ